MNNLILGISSIVSVLIVLGLAIWYDPWFFALFACFGISNLLSGWKYTRLGLGIDKEEPEEPT